MLISTKWLCTYLPPGSPTTEAIQHALIEAGFPIESVTPLPSGASA